MFSVASVVYDPQRPFAPQLSFTRKAKKGDVLGDASGIVTLTACDFANGRWHLGMKPVLYCRHRFLPSVTEQAVWLYYPFTLSFRDIEDLLAERGINASYETVRRWRLKFGPTCARCLRVPLSKPQST